MLSFDQQQSSTSFPPPPLPRLTWFLLVDSETGEPYKGTGVDAVALPPDALVLQVRKLVHLENASILTGIVSSQLFVFKNKAAFDRRRNAEDQGKEQPLKPSRNLDGLGESEEAALIVAVPSPRNDILDSNKKLKKTTPYWFLLLDSTTGKPFKGTTAFFVSLPSGADVAEFRKLVHLENSTILTDIATSQLLVFKNKAAFNRRNNVEDDGKEQPLDPYDSIGVLGSKEDMLVVAVPPPYQTPSFYPCPVPFFNIIREATETGEWISFGQEHIPFTSLKRLYIRKCYETIASSILQVSGIHKAIIFGTPGIGKSLFLIYLLWRLVKEGKRVLFIYGSFYIYYDGNGGVFLLDMFCLPVWYDSMFWNDTLWCLFDAKGKKESDLWRLPVGLSTFIVSTSPRPEMVNDYKKPPVPQVFYMPIWKESELERISPLFPEANNEWRNRFTILGGIPRFVLEVRTDSPTAILTAACADCSLDDCVKMININSRNISKASHSLVHITSESPFTTSSMDFASPTAKGIIIQCKTGSAKHKIQELLINVEGNPVAAVLCGYIFERYAIELLEKGGRFTVRQLVGGNTQTPPNETTETIDIPSSTKVIVDEVVGGKTPLQLHVPEKKNYSGIDAWIPGIGAFQMTVSENHNINEQAIRDLAELGANSKFYFALPLSVYESFTKQEPLDIDQYAILIPYQD